MELKELTIIKSIIITITSLLGGIVAFFLPGQLGIMSPDKWYDDPLALILIGLICGGVIGWGLSFLIKQRPSKQNDKTKISQNADF